MRFGPSFGAELAAANCADGIAWNEDVIVSDLSTVTAAQQAVINAHDPTKPDRAVIKTAAQAALDRSDVTVLRCYENSVVVPAAWAAYRGALRAIVGGTDTGSTTLPVQPDYPAGT